MWHMTREQLEDHIVELEAQIERLTELPKTPRVPSFLPRRAESPIALDRGEASMAQKHQQGLRGDVLMRRASSLDCPRAVAFTPQQCVPEASFVLTFLL